jgi:lantibiotic leader peptide-processing serine protease
VNKLVGALAALGALGALLVVSAGAGAGTTPKSYLISANGNASSAAFKAQVEAAGGTVTNVIAGANIAVASTTSADFASKARALGPVAPNLKVQWITPVKNIDGPGVDFANPPTSGDDDVFFDLQWGHDAIDAVEAWNAGYRGAGARVAVLDTGFDLDHPDLAPNINMALSQDFTGQGLQYTLPDPFSHGTHTAGTVAAADNGFGVIGVAPQAELVLGKVLFDEGFGTFEDVLEGIAYAAGPADADVISMSLGAVIPKAGDPTDPDLDTPEEVDALKHAMNRATNFAYRNGATVIASAGNDAIDRDAHPELLVLPADAQNVLQISATAPVGWATAPTTTFLDNQASYTNYGRSAIDFAAPGGDFVYPGNENCTIVVTRPCWVFDLVFSTGNNGWFWSAGTSMAAPHAAGVAALIVGKAGGSLSAAQVEKAINAGADDLGPGGRDDTYGRGRVNADGST